LVEGHAAILANYGGAVASQGMIVKQDEPVAMNLHNFQPGANWTMTSVNHMRIHPLRKDIKRDAAEITGVP
jgi:hypothetical protein